jgi:hypothetical protein
LLISTEREGKADSLGKGIRTDKNVAMGMHESFLFTVFTVFIVLEERSFTELKSWEEMLGLEGKDVKESCKKVGE